jgi:hypothetical protein
MASSQAGRLAGKEEGEDEKAGQAAAVAADASSCPHRLQRLKPPPPTAPPSTTTTTTFHHHQKQEQATASAALSASGAGDISPINSLRRVGARAVAGRVVRHICFRRYVERSR